MNYVEWYEAVLLYDYPAGFYVDAPITEGNVMVLKHWCSK